MYTYFNNCDRDGKVLWANTTDPNNPVKMDDLMGTRWQDWMPQSQHAKLTATCGHTLLTGDPVEFSVPIGPLGQERNYACRVERVSPTGQTAFVAMAREEPCELTDLELAILLGVCDGLALPQIAKARGISLRSAERGRQTLGAKIGTDTVAGIVKYAVRTGLTSLF